MSSVVCIDSPTRPKPRSDIQKRAAASVVDRVSARVSMNRKTPAVGESSSGPLGRIPALPTRPYQLRCVQHLRPLRSPSWVRHRVRCGSVERGYRSDLLEELEGVQFVPVLLQTAVADPPDVDRVQLDLGAAWRDAHERARVPSAVREAAD